MCLRGLQGFCIPHFSRLLGAISVAPKDVALTVGDTKQLTVTVTATGGASKAVTWSSSDTDVATVDENGLVTAVAEGEANITAASKFDNTKSDSCVVTVEEIKELTPGEQAKADFLETLQGKVKEEPIVEVADVDIAEDEDDVNITVTFDADVDIRAVQDAAEGLFSSMIEGAEAGTIAFDEGEEINLFDTNATEIAKALLGGGYEKAIAFLETGEAITANYEAKLTVEGAEEFTIKGELVFAVKKALTPGEQAKADFLETLQGKVKEEPIVEVADVDIAEDEDDVNITVTFDADVDIRAVQDAAEGLFSSMIEGAEAGTIAFDEGEEINLFDTNATEIAKALLGGGYEKAIAFLETGDPITANYEAKLTVEGAEEFTIKGELVFAVKKAQ